jgi:hypothetical protein
MSENGNNLSSLAANSAKKISYFLQNRASLALNPASKVDGYDGTAETDSLFGEMNMLKQFALKNGKGV